MNPPTHLSQWDPAHPVCIHLSPPSAEPLVARGAPWLNTQPHSHMRSPVAIPGVPWLNMQPHSHTWSPVAIRGVPWLNMQRHSHTRSPVAIRGVPWHPQAVARGAPPDPRDLPATRGPAGLLLLWPRSRDHIGSVLVLITRHTHLLPCIHHCQEHYPLNKAHPPYYCNVNSEPLR